MYVLRWLWGFLRQRTGVLEVAGQQGDNICLRYHPHQVTILRE